MDELAKALAQAITAGSATAPAAIHGYFALRIIETLANNLVYPITFGVIGFSIYSVVLGAIQVDKQK